MIFKTCYKVLGIFHSNWSTIPGRFKDFISTPKINNYKSIHTAIIGPLKGKGRNTNSNATNARIC